MITFQAGNRTAKLGQTDAPFSPPPDRDLRRIGNVATEDLARAINGVQRAAAANDEGRPMFTGICFRDGYLFAADGFVAAKAQLFDRAVNGWVEPVESPILPAASARELAKVARSYPTGTHANLSQSSSYLIVQIEQTTWKGRLLDGVFPNINQFLTVDPVTTAVIDRKQLRSEVALGRLYDVTVDKGNKRDRVTLGIADHDLQIETQATERGSSRCTLRACIAGPAITVNVSARLVQDALDSMESEEVTLNLTNPYKPIVITGDERVTWAVMPMV